MAGLTGEDTYKEIIMRRLTIIPKGYANWTVRKDGVSVTAKSLPLAVNMAVKRLEQSYGEERIKKASW